MCYFCAFELVMILHMEIRLFRASTQNHLICLTTYNNVAALHCNKHGIFKWTNEVCDNSLWMELRQRAFSKGAAHHRGWVKQTSYTHPLRTKERIVWPLLLRFLFLARNTAEASQWNHGGGGVVSHKVTYHILQDTGGYYHFVSPDINVRML